MGSPLLWHELQTNSINERIEAGWHRTFPSTLKNVCGLVLSHYCDILSFMKLLIISFAMGLLLPYGLCLDGSGGI